MSGRGRKATLERLVLAAVVLSLCALPISARVRNEHVQIYTPVWVEDIAKNAPATSEHDLVWLHEEQVVEPDLSGGVIVRVRYAAKVFKPSALEIPSDYFIYYAKGDEVREVGGWSFAPDGTKHQLDPKDDVVDMPAVPGNLSFDDSRYKRVTIPGVVVGSVVAFEYVRHRQLDTGSDGFTFGAETRPTLFSRFELVAPADHGWEWDAMVLRGDDLEVVRNDGGATYIARDLQPLDRVPRRPDANRILPQVWLHWQNAAIERGFKSWDDVGNWARELNDPGLKDPGEAATLAAEFKPEGPQGLLDSINQAFAFASRDIRYVAIDIGLGVGNGYRASTPSEVCSKRYGDCKDKSFLMRALTEPWGVKTYAVLVRTRSMGPLPVDTPAPSHFNHCIAAIALPDGVGDSLWSTVEVDGIGRVVFLDATDGSAGPWNLPWGDQGTTALLVHPEGGKLVTLPVQPPRASGTEREVIVEVDENGGIVRADLEERWRDAGSGQVRDYYSNMTDAEREASVLENLQDRFPGSAVSSYEIIGLDDVNADVIERTSLTGGRLGKRVGDLLILEPGKTGYSLLGGNLPKPPRRWPFRIGRPRMERLKVSIRVPDGWAPEAVPPELNVTSPYIQAEGSWKFDGGLTVYDRKMSIEGVEVPVDDYPAFHEKMRQVRRRDSLAVVFVKSSG